MVVVGGGCGGALGGQWGRGGTPLKAYVPLLVAKGMALWGGRKGWNATVRGRSDVSAPFPHPFIASGRGWRKG